MAYNSEARRRSYLATRDKTLAQCKAARSLCPICKITYGNSYLHRHLTHRHVMTSEEATRLITADRQRHKQQ